MMAIMLDENTKQYENKKTTLKNIIDANNDNRRTQLFYF